MMEKSDIHPGQLIYLIDRNPNYKGTVYEGTVSAHKEGSPGYVGENIAQTQPVMFLKMERYVDVSHDLGGVLEKIYTKVFFIHNDSVWSTLIGESCHASDYLRLAL